MAELLGISEDTCLDFRRRTADAGSRIGDDALFPEFFVTRGCFSDAIGKEQQAVSGLELQQRVLILPVWKNSQHCAPVLQLPDFAVLADENRVQVSSIGVMQGACLRIQQSVKKCTNFPVPIFALSTELTRRHKADGAAELVGEGTHGRLPH